MVLPSDDDDIDDDDDDAVLISNSMNYVDLRNNELSRGQQHDATSTILLDQEAMMKVVVDEEAMMNVVVDNIDNKKLYVDF